MQKYTPWQICDHCQEISNGQARENEIGWRLYHVRLCQNNNIEQITRYSEKACNRTNPPVDKSIVVMELIDKRFILRVGNDFCRLCRIEKRHFSKLCYE